MKKLILSRLPNMAFLCGGNKKTHMRKRFLKYVKSERRYIFISGEAVKNIFSNERIILAEQAEKLWDRFLKDKNSGYDSLLEFELDIAELVSVIPIFLESPGAMVETGAFFCKPNLRKKLLIIVKEKHFKDDSFINRAILNDPSLEGKVIYYDENNIDHKKKTLEEIFNFREKHEHRIEICTEETPISLYFFLLQTLGEWKNKDEIIKELNKQSEFKQYKEKLDNHLKILISLGLIEEVPYFNKKLFLSLIRSDCLLDMSANSNSDTFSQNKHHEIDNYNEVISKVESDLRLLKRMRESADKKHFLYSYNKHHSKHYKIPEPQLKTLQKLLKTRILNNQDIFPIHESATAYREKGSIRQNIEKHCNNQFILTLDFKNFFESIKQSDFLKYLKISIKNQNFQEYSSLICDIAFRDNSIKDKDFSLPIGASTSPIISNILLYNFDNNISEYSDTLDITYTRYADDLTFSHNKPNKLCDVINKVENTLKQIPYLSNLQINDKKTTYMSKKGRRKITGLYLTPEGKVSIGRNKKNYIKKLLRDYKNKHMPEKLKYIQGHLCFVKSVEQDFWIRLHDKYITNKSTTKNNKMYNLFYNSTLKLK